MKNNKRIVMVAIFLIIAVVAISATPLMRSNQATSPRQEAMLQQPTQALQQRQMLQEQELREEVLAAVSQEQKDLMEARRAEALARQETARAQAIGQGFRGQGKGVSRLQ
ncbi:MAG: hypothetical protein EOM15_03740 [Spirochaetia bacterium]|nr:hypothetical protein [Spirochaetia bacterium]